MYAVVQDSEIVGFFKKLKDARRCAEDQLINQPDDDELWRYNKIDSHLLVLNVKIVDDWTPDGIFNSLVARFDDDTGA